MIIHTETQPNLPQNGKVSFTFFIAFLVDPIHVITSD